MPIQAPKDLQMMCPDSSQMQANQKPDPWAVAGKVCTMQTTSLHSCVWCTHAPTSFASTMQNVTSTSDTDFPVSFTSIPEGWFPTSCTRAPTGGFQPALAGGTSANSLSLSRPQPHPLQQGLDVSVGLLPSLLFPWVLASAVEVVAPPYRCYSCVLFSSLCF